MINLKLSSHTLSVLPKCLLSCPAGGGEISISGSAPIQCPISGTPLSLAPTPNYFPIPQPHSWIFKLLSLHHKKWFNFGSCLEVDYTQIHWGAYLLTYSTLFKRNLPYKQEKKNLLRTKTVTTQCDKYCTRERWARCMGAAGVWILPKGALGRPPQGDVGSFWQAGNRGSTWLTEGRVCTKVQRWESSWSMCGAAHGEPQDK